mmetsp:Transcript_29385/g.70878  ORF Transcript_29385/g.70878 Transcript_29385/m.70878 type:complete len:193 (+) Transcript_29385:115-693(+)
MVLKLSVAALVVALVATSTSTTVDAFVMPQSSSTTLSSAATSSKTPKTSDTQLFMDDEYEIPYGEESRKYRRTVYTHDDWVKHRSPNRFVGNLWSIPRSGIYKNMGREIVATSSVALFVFLYNMLTGGYDDFSQIHHDPLIGFLPKMTLPLAPFTLASSSLGLLLVFRTNTAYQRWDEARKNWGMNMYVLYE